MASERRGFLEVANLLDVSLISGILPMHDQEEASNPSMAPPSPSGTVDVFARVRPLIEGEVSEGVSSVIDVPDAGAGAISPSLTMSSNGQQISGLSGVLGPEADNKSVFQATFSDKISIVLGGGVASLFCYGYTGGGKTHTVLGYGDDEGLYSLAASAVLDELRNLNRTDVILTAQSCEVYGDKVYDLLGENKVECALKTSAGKLQIVGETTVTDLADGGHGIPQSVVDAVRDEKEYSAEMGDKGRHLTLVRRSVGLRRVFVRGPEDLKAVSASALRQRAVGTSTEHDQSSRSHAVVIMEVTTEDILKAQTELEEAESLLPAVNNAADNLAQQYWEQLADLSTKSDLDHTLCLRTYEDPNEWQKRKDDLDARRPRLIEAYNEAEDRIRAAKERLEEAKKNAGFITGGSLVLVDLAGADYDARDVGKGTTAKEKKESADINKSLLALKKCLRSISGVPGESKRPPFRDSKLTRILEDALAPGRASQRSKRDNKSVMVLAVSPSSRIERMTLNTLRYGEMFACKDNKKAVGRIASAGTAAASKVSRGPLKPWQQKAAANRPKSTSDQISRGGDIC